MANVQAVSEKSARKPRGYLLTHPVVELGNKTTFR